MLTANILMQLLFGMKTIMDFHFYGLVIALNQVYALLIYLVIGSVR